MPDPRPKFASRPLPDLRKQRDLARLGDEISELAAHIHAATFQLLELIRAFDEQKGWNRDGARSCAHWLNWQAQGDPTIPAGEVMRSERHQRAECLWQPVERSRFSPKAKEGKRDSLDAA